MRCRSSDDGAGREALLSVEVGADFSVPTASVPEVTEVRLVGRPGPEVGAAGSPEVEGRVGGPANSSLGFEVSAFAESLPVAGDLGGRGGVTALAAGEEVGRGALGAAATAESAAVSGEVAVSVSGGLAFVDPGGV